MTEQISSDNTKKVLLEGNGVKAAPQPRPIHMAKKNQADVVVENSTEKRYLWTARAFAIVFAVSLSCNLILTYVIMSTIPLYRIEPYLFSFSDKKEQIYRIEPVSRIYEYKYLTEIFVREYVLLRNTFINDIDEMESRWGENGTLREMSDDAIYTQFRKDHANPIIEQIRKYNVTRNVKILSVTEVGRGKNNGVWWEVEFRVEDMSPEFETPRVSIWVVQLQIRYKSKRVKFGERLKNPLGFTVINYKQSKRDK